MSLNNVGVCCEILGDLQMTENYYRRALNIFDRTLPMKHFECLRTEQNIQIISNKLKTKVLCFLLPRSTNLRVGSYRNLSNPMGSDRNSQKVYLFV